MAMQITPEQTDWLKGFLSRAGQEMRPEMAVNTAGPATGGAPEPAPLPLPPIEVPNMDTGQEKAEDVPIYWPPPATPAPEESGLLERMDDSVNRFGAWVFGSAGRVEPPTPDPMAVPAPSVQPNRDTGQEKAEDVPIYWPPPAAPPSAASSPSVVGEPGIVERMGSAIGSLFD